MLLSPKPFEAMVAIAEGAGQRDLTDVGGRVEAGRRSLKRCERARNLAGLELKPFRLMPFDRALAGLVADENRGIHDAVGERLQAQRCKAQFRVLGDDAAAAGAMIEIFE